MKTIKFTVPGEPFGKQRPRVVRTRGGSRAYTPSKTVEYEKLVRQCYEQVADGYRVPKDVAIRVYITAYYGIPKSTTKKRREEMLELIVRPTKKPDIDNIAKAVCDSLNSVAYHDDSQIVEANLSKWYGEKPMVLVVLEEVLP